ncbi:cytidine/deoxycytidylate deaminase family protein [Plantactinospora siamensis]
MSPRQLLIELERVAQRGTCLKRKVAAFVVLDGSLAITATNDTPPGMARCLDGGCSRCAAADVPHRTAYDLCICVHAEESAIAQAACSGRALRGAILITNYQPCVTCAKLIISTAFSGVWYIEPWVMPKHALGIPGVADDYERLWRLLPNGCRRLSGLG